MSLTSLPDELLCLVCSYMQLPEWQALRLSSRHFYEASSDSFADRYFKSIRVIATSDGLSDLEEMTKSEAVRNRAQEFWMIPTVIECDKNMTLPLYVYDSSKSCQELEGAARKTRHAVCQTIVADNLSQLQSENFGFRLRRCLASFRRLDLVGLAHYPAAFLFDPRQQKARALGLRRLRQQLDLRCSPKYLYHVRSPRVAEVNSLAMDKLLLALSESGSRIRALQTCNADQCGVVDLRIGLSQAQYDSAISALDALEDLHVCVNLCEPVGRPIRMPHSECEAVAAPTWFNLMLKVAPRLKKLALSQDEDNGYKSRPYYFGELSRRIELTRLRELHLQWCHVTSHALKSLVASAKRTLTTFSLSAVTLADEMPPVTNEDLDVSATVAPSASEDDSPDFPGSPDFPNDARLEDQEALLWKPVWDCFRDELSLQRFSMSKIACRSSQVIFIPGPYGATDDVHFDSETTGTSFSEWIDGLTPIPSGNRNFWWYGERMTEWFKRMIPPNRSLSNPLPCPDEGVEWCDPEDCPFWYD